MDRGGIVELQKTTLAPLRGSAKSAVNSPGGNCQIRPGSIFFVPCSALFAATLLLGSSASPRFESFHDYVIRPDEKTELFVREFGKPTGAPIIVLHGGWGAEHSYLIRPLQHLSRNYRLVFYDQRGSLRSRTDPATISVDRHIQDLDYLIKAIGQPNVTLVGHSMGGYLGAAYTVRFPQRVNRLLLIAPVPAKLNRDFWTQMDARVKSLAGKEDDIVAELEKHGLARTQNPNGFTEKQDLLRRKLFFASAGGNIYRWKELWKDVPLGFYNADAGGLAAATMPESSDFTKALSELTIPIAVAYAEQDYIDPQAQVEWLKQVPRARGTLIKNAAHLVWWDQPKAFRSWIDGALRDR